MWRRYSRLLFRFASVSFRDASEFRSDFLMSLAHNLLYQGIFILFWKSVLDFTPAGLGAWTFPQLAVLSAFTLLATALMQWFMGFLQLSGKILQGEVDKYLCKPISPLFALWAESINALASAQQLVSAALIIAGVCVYYRVPVTPGAALAGLGLLALGCLVVILIQGCIAMLAFWLGDVSRINTLLQITGNFERYPINLFPPWLQGMLTWVVPIGLISTYPVMVFLGKAEEPWRYLATGLVLAAVWGLIFRETWRRALRRYESFGG